MSSRNYHHPRALSTVTNSHNNGVMNSPYKKDMRNAIFYQPRQQEAVYENALMNN